MQRLPQRSRLRESKAHHVVENFVQIRKTWIFLWFLFFFRVGFFFFVFVFTPFFCFSTEFFFLSFFFLFSRIFPGRRRGEEEPVSTVLPCTASARGRARPGRRIPLKHHALCLFVFCLFFMCFFPQILKKKQHRVSPLPSACFVSFLWVFFFFLVGFRLFSSFGMVFSAVSRDVPPRLASLGRDGARGGVAGAGDGMPVVHAGGSGGRVGGGGGLGDTRCSWTSRGGFSLSPPGGGVPGDGGSLGPL